MLKSSVAAIGLALVLAGCTTDDDAAPPPEPCLGSVATCDTPLQEVALLGSHQSAATAAAGEQWVAPWTNLTLGQQLDRGVRGLWLEVRTGVPHEAGVATDPAGPPPPKPVSELTAQFAARQAAIALSPETGPPAAYLCAGPCELGARPLVEALREIDAWLVERPRELVILVVDDYSADGQWDAALRNSMLDRRVIAGEAAPTDTVGDLLGGGQVLLLDQAKGTIDTGGSTPRPGWIDATGPLSAGGTGGCAATGDSLLLIKHWRAGTAPALADAVADNNQQVIAPRLSQCRSATGRLPGLLMLAFTEVGDGLRALDQVAASG